jgi:putative transcriptional regulator
MAKSSKSEPAKMVVVTLEELEKEPYRIPPEERARLDAMTHEEIERLAESDPENPPPTDAQLDRGVFGRQVRLTRQSLGMTQEEFAAALRLPLATLRNWEQGRFDPDPAARALMAIVAANPKLALAALAA